MQMHVWSAQDFVAGELCLEFTNTVGDHTKTREIEWLPDWDAVLRWAMAVAALEPIEVEALRNIGRRHSAAARRGLQQLLDFRELLYRVLSALAAGRVPPQVDFKRFEIVVLGALRVGRLTQKNRTFSWTVRPTEATIKTPLARIALSALQLLQSDNLSRLSECQRCSWLFLDRSKNRGRLWCRADVCGNRVRVARHYRTRAA